MNPLQFGPNEDFARYPRTFDADLARCAASAASTSCTRPTPEAHVPAGLSDPRRGRAADARASRARSGPTHFRGVTTVVTKLFTAVGPCVARVRPQGLPAVARARAHGARPRPAGRGGRAARSCASRTVSRMSSRNRYLDADAARARAGHRRGPARRRTMPIAAGERDAARARRRWCAQPIAARSIASTTSRPSDPETLEPLERRRATAVVLARGRAPRHDAPDRQPRARATTRVLEPKLQREQRRRMLGAT